MQDIDFQFEVVEPDYPDAIVPTPQVIIFQLDINTRQIEVHFMENTAFTIADGVVTSGMGTLNLWYTVKQPIEYATASQRLRKVVYRFPNSRGMAQNVKFHGVRN